MALRRAAAPARLLRRLSTTAFAAPGVNYAAHILSFVEAEARRAPAKAAFIDTQTGRVTPYGDYAYRVGAAARGFAAAGVGRGSVVSLHLPNCSEYVVAFTALASLGATATMSNPLYSPTELAHQLKDSGARWCVTVAPLAPVVAAAGMPAAATLVLGAPSGAFLSADVSAGSHALRALPELATVDAAADVLALPYSSGTTGLSKGVALSHDNLVSNIEQTKAIGLTSSDVLLGILPLYHI
jgi:acyl-CoA synthetase (AMP-forming)/AMP-acid ligase II